MQTSYFFSLCLCTPILASTDDSSLQQLLLPNCHIIFLLFLLHSLVAFVMYEKDVSPIHLFIYSIYYIYMEPWIFISWAIIHYIFCCCINCPIPGQWEFLPFGSYVLLAFPSAYEHVLSFLRDRILWAHLVFSLPNVGINHSSKTSSSFFKRMASRNQDLDTGSSHAW